MWIAKVSATASPKRLQRFLDCLLSRLGWLGTGFTERSKGKVPLDEAMEIGEAFKRFDRVLAQYHGHGAVRSRWRRPQRQLLSRHGRLGRRALRELGAEELGFPAGTGHPRKHHNAPLYHSSAERHPTHRYPVWREVATSRRGQKSDGHYEFLLGLRATIFVGATQGTATGSGCFAFIHDCDGTEPSATTVTVNTEASRPVVRAYRISGAQGAEGTGTFTSGTATYDPPALDPAGWGTEDTL